MPRPEITKEEINELKLIYEQGGLTKDQADKRIANLIEFQNSLSTRPKSPETHIKNVVRRHKPQ